jgi:hypothetical protein
LRFKMYHIPCCFPAVVRNSMSQFITTLHQPCTQHSRISPPSHATILMPSIPQSAYPDLQLFVRFSFANKTYRLQEHTREHRTNERPLNPIQIHPALALVELCVHWTVGRDAAMLCGPIRRVLTRLRWRWMGVQIRIEFLIRVCEFVVPEDCGRGVGDGVGRCGYGHVCCRCIACVGG